jgi:hypothetical protein
MRKIILCSLLLLCSSLFGISQTKRIAHHSHSGSDATFALGGDDNFGLSPAMQRAMDSTRHTRDSIRIACYRDSIKHVPKKPKK